jgi:hypothetical protein
MSCIFGENRDIYFPKLSESLHLITFSEIATKFLNNLGYQAHVCSSEEEAREAINLLKNKKEWPVLFSSSDTTGEKDFEEFFTDKEVLDTNRFDNIGVIKNEGYYDETLLDLFEERINAMKLNLGWEKEQIVNLFFKMIPGFLYKEKGKYLDGKM